MKKLTFLLLLLLSYTGVFAQSNLGVTMDDTLQSSGKIYVVVSIIAIIFVGLALYLFSIDRRLKKIENEK
ncbi:CcmD family protein [Mucilaginibacter sp. E4BP6]|jgi:CcmD family protein|uniref:CcmD family protein n=1 Tax=Mucilaginibacter sp. E4BP6 TaxID=2723089 RepID=UPI0015C9E838|nr:CcmD family protein [Mucilaginibacter sp. E4BP6]NYE66565.1 CcmD family protein [Mucilaginibacter sp. E4BP6]